MKRVPLVLLIVCLVLPSCSKGGRPPGMPALNPCTLKFSQDGAPLADAFIQLIPEDESLRRWPVNGYTDSGGIAKMVTYGQFPGVPVGHYAVVVRKTETITIIEPTDYSKGEHEEYSLVDDKFADAKTSDIAIKIEKGKNEKSFDLGKAVRNRIDID